MLLGRSVGQWVGEITKKTLFLLLFACCCAFSFAQSVGDGAATVNEDTAIIQPAENSESNYPITAPTSGSDIRTGLGAGAYIRMIIVLLIIIGIIWLFARFFKKNINGGSVEENPFMLRRVASISLGAGKSVQIVTLLDNKGFLLGVSDDGVSLLGTIDDVELIQALNLNADRAENAPRPKNFADILEIFTKKKGSSSSPTASQSSSEDALGFLKKQRDRLGGNEE